MSRRQSLPSYTLHRPSGQARVRIQGRDIYLGPHDSAESRERYAQLLLNLARQHQSIAVDRRWSECTELKVKELVLKYCLFAEEYYGMRGRDIDRSSDVWIYRPERHKGSHLGSKKEICLGPQAQAIVQPFLDRPSDNYLFSPKEAEEWRNEQRSASRNPDRKTKIYPSELRARARRKVQAKSRIAKRPKRERFDTDSYRRAIVYAIAKAGKMGVEIVQWHPHQLRHLRATEVRKEFGLEAAQVTLGHTRADVTQIYAERNSELAIQVARKIG